MSTLIALVAAITVVTITLGGTMVIVEDAFRETQRGDAERAVAIQASDRLVAADGPIADAPNVVNESELANLSTADLRRVGATNRFAMAVALDGERIAALGDPDGGHVVRRIVLVQSSERAVRTPTIVGGEDPELTVPVRTDAVEVTISPPPGTTVTEVRSGGRVVLADPGGLSGTFDVETSPYRTLAFAFDTTGPLATGDVEIAYRSTDRDRAILAVTVDDRDTAGGGGESV
ncbi:hypothetical protein L593_06880 [Salinarchaeum sp. Harcht-Bsk1]|uniref:DUF7263 family protein n=1 Tax=Salinarchaeum sp. Harcht-Bsk1 TaxID=1333523 RepID=UPI0003423F89|nr:hypothetical protein [Salinarchaeum sp. Harcht-Bsk1]AGN01323.1 hypothetical protein L593_06880 [Salinarchaeum sp. Harcht-Bsk1]